MIIIFGERVRGSPGALWCPPTMHLGESGGWSLFNVMWRETHSALKPYKTGKRQQRDTGDLIYLNPDHFWRQKNVLQNGQIKPCLSCWRADPVLSDLGAAVIDRFGVTLANMLLTFVCSVASQFCPNSFRPTATRLLMSMKMFHLLPKRLL